MVRQLIVNADDFGLTPGVNRGIIDSHLNGIVTSTSVMVNMPFAEEAIKAAQEQAPNLGLGLHLNLTRGTPVTQPETLDFQSEKGVFLPPPKLLERLPTIPVSLLEAELRAQVDRFIQFAGRPPDHLDSHHHITYLAPHLFTLMARIAHELSISIRYPLTGHIDDPDMAVQKQFLGAYHQLPDAYWMEMSNILDQVCRSGQVRTPDTFIASFFGDNAILADLLLVLLDISKGVSELMCHPAYVDEALIQDSTYVHERYQELQALTHPSAREVVTSENIRLISFKDVW
nr:ChbG/HpnK family deacetylase [Anaerolineae bacterium]